MKILAINGSPRKNRNTATLLKKALEGAESKGAETEIINLYDLTYKGCTSCFACKRISGKSYGKCAMKDDLTEVLQKIEEADAFILGSPIYLGRESGMMSSFLERLIFQYLVYDGKYSSLFDRKIPTGFIFTMNATEDNPILNKYHDHIDSIKAYLSRTFGECETLLVHDTYQFDDYSKYVSTGFDEAHKAEVRDNIFPIACRKSYKIGENLASDI